MEIKSQFWVGWEHHLGAPGASKGRSGFRLREDGSGSQLQRTRWDGGTTVLKRGLGAYGAALQEENGQQLEQPVVAACGWEEVTVLVREKVVSW